jgi:hypothetical protein
MLWIVSDRLQINMFASSSKENFCIRIQKMDLK